MNYARSWALRCQLEALSYKDNCFITLTFSNEELEKKKKTLGLLMLKIFSFLWKSLEKDLTKLSGSFTVVNTVKKPLDLIIMPYSLVMIFRIPSNNNTIKKFGKKYPLYESSELTALWGRGHTTVGELNFDTASYTARYVTKKRKRWCY